MVPAIDRDPKVSLWSSPSRRTQPPKCFLSVRTRLKYPLHVSHVLKITTYSCFAPNTFRFFFFQSIKPICRKRGANVEREENGCRQGFYDSRKHVSPPFLFLTFYAAFCSCEMKRYIVLLPNILFHLSGMGSSNFFTLEL